MPAKSLSAIRRAANAARKTKSGGTNGGRPRTEAVRCPCGCGCTLASGMQRHPKRIRAETQSPASV